MHWCLQWLYSSSLCQSILGCRYPENSSLSLSLPGLYRRQSSLSKGRWPPIIIIKHNTWQCLSKRHRKVELYLEKRSSTVSSIKSASLEKSSLDSKSCWKAFLSNLLQVRTLNKSKTVTGCTGRRPSIKEWSEIDGACTKISGEGWSDRVIKTSRIPPLLCVGELTCCTSPNDWRYSLNLTVWGSTGFSKWILKSPTTVMGHRKVTSIMQV